MHSDLVRSYDHAFLTHYFKHPRCLLKVMCSIAQIDVFTLCLESSCVSQSSCKTVANTFACCQMLCGTCQHLISDMLDIPGLATLCWTPWTWAGILVGPSDSGRIMPKSIKCLEMRFEGSWAYVSLNASILMTYDMYLYNMYAYCICIHTHTCTCAHT